MKNGTNVSRFPERRDLIERTLTMQSEHIAMVSRFATEHGLSFNDAINRILELAIEEEEQKSGRPLPPNVVHFSPRSSEEEKR